MFRTFIFVICLTIGSVTYKGIILIRKIHFDPGIHAPVIPIDGGASAFLVTAGLAGAGLIGRKKLKKKK